MARFKVGTKVLLRRVDGEKLKKPVTAKITDNNVDGIGGFFKRYRYEVKTFNHHSMIESKDFNDEIDYTRSYIAGTTWYVNGRDFKVLS